MSLAWHRLVGFVVLVATSALNKGRMTMMRTYTLFFLISLFLLIFMPSAAAWENIKGVCVSNCGEPPAPPPVYTGPTAEELAARQAAEQAARDAATANSWNAAGNAKYLKGDYSGAIADHEEALKYSPNDSVIRDNLRLAKVGRASQLASDYRSQGNFAAAIQAYEEAVRLDPGNSVWHALIDSVKGQEVTHRRQAEQEAVTRKQHREAEARKEQDSNTASQMRATLRQFIAAMPEVEDSAPPGAADTSLDFMPATRHHETQTIAGAQLKSATLHSKTAAQLAELDEPGVLDPARKQASIPFDGPKGQRYAGPIDKFEKTPDDSRPNMPPRFQNHPTIVKLEKERLAAVSERRKAEAELQAINEALKKPDADKNALAVKRVTVSEKVTKATQKENVARINEEDEARKLSFSEPEIPTTSQGN